MTSLAPDRLADADDRTLAGRAADGDVRAFEVILRRYGPLMRAYATRILRSNDESDDVVQEAFIAAWQQLPELKNPATVKNWLLTIVTRRAIDRVRARSRHDHLSIDDYEPEADPLQSPAARAEVGSRDEALSAALSALPEDQRRCWMLREIAQYSYDDIAGQLDLPASTVRGLLARARKTLIAEMEAWR